MRIQSPNKRIPFILGEKVVSGYEKFPYRIRSHIWVEIENLTYRNVDLIKDAARSITQSEAYR